MISTTCPVCRGEGGSSASRATAATAPALDHRGRDVGGEHPGGRRGRFDAALVGRGEAAPRGGRAGNLYVVLRVQPDERFERDGADLHTEVPVSFPQPALGDTVEVPTLDGEGAIDIRRAPSPARRSCCAAGACRASTSGDGATSSPTSSWWCPSSLTAEEEAHLRAYAASGGQRVSPEKGGFFKRKKK